MNLRREEELPQLTPDQQIEAIRLAARLQEEETTRQDLLLAAEEAGIEPRFLREAAARIAAAPQAKVKPSESASNVVDWIRFTFLATTFVVLSTAYVGWDRQNMGQRLPIALGLATLECVSLATFWMRRKHTFVFVLATQMTLWLMLDLVLNIEFGGPNNLASYMPVLGVETTISLVGTAIAWTVLALVNARTPRVGHNPKA